MAERPILFSAPMVRAILAGKKSQTRRIVKPRREDGAIVDVNPDGMPIERSGGGRGFRAVRLEVLDRCPYGVPGDRLWVRETFRAGGSGNLKVVGLLAGIHYRADLDEPEAPGQWKPAIFMPHWASRITLAVTSVRVERLQDISEEDARAEGMEGNHAIGDERGFVATMQNVYRRTFARGWDGINGKRGSWDDNPWVWVVGFSVAKRER